MEAASRGSRGVRELVEKLGWKTSRAITLLETMEEEGLIELQETRLRKRGRPKKIVKPTPLGLDFHEGYRSLAAKPLRSRRADLERAARDALYVERLVSRGVEPFRVFMELNEIVRAVSVSSASN